DGDFEQGVGRWRGERRARADDGGDRDEDERHAGELGGGEAFTEQCCADDDGDGRVHKGVGGDLGDGHVLQQVGVGRESDDRADDGEEGDGGQAGGGPVRGAQVSACEGEQDVNDAGGADLPGGGDEGVHAEAEAAREDGADGEDEAGDDEDGVAGDGGAVRSGGADGAQRG